MDREQLFQNLNELEKQLKGIKSATEHVNQVVAADHELVMAVDDFTKEAVRLIESTRGTFEAEIKVMQKAASETLNKSAADFSAKILNLGAGFSEALETMFPSLHPLDLLIGLMGAVCIRLAVYVKGKNAKKYRKGMEYGSARWGTAEDAAEPVIQSLVR